VTTFDAVAQDYDRTVERSVPYFPTEIQFFHRNKIHHLARLARLAKVDLSSARVLDVGCGTGAADQMLRPMVGSLCGMDISIEMVAQAKAVGADVDHRVYDGRILPFEADSFDLAFAFNVLHHVPPQDWTSFVRLMMSAIRPGGLCVVVEHNQLNPITRRSVRDCPFDEDAVLVKPRELRRMFRMVGADVVAKWYILFAPFGGSRALRLEETLSWLPLGGQYLYAVQRPFTDGVQSQFT
jgi:SAM-dependent methyltransferase